MTATAPRARRHAGALGVCVGAALGLLLIAFASGGYFPTAWTWGALLALVFVAAALVVGNVVRPSRLALVSLGGLTGFGVWTWLALLWSSNPPHRPRGLRVLFYVAVLAGLCWSCAARTSALAGGHADRDRRSHPDTGS